MIVSTLHKVGSNILCIFLPDFQVGGRNSYNPESEIPDDKIFTPPSTFSFLREGLSFLGKGGEVLLPF